MTTVYGRKSKVPNRIEIPSRDFIKAVARKSKLFMSSPDRIEAAEKFFTYAYRAGALNEAKRQEEVIKKLQQRLREQEQPR